MKRNQIVFFLIIAVAAGIIAIGFGLQAWNEAGDNNGSGQATPADSSGGEPITVEVAAGPLVENWISSAAEAYNQTNPKVGNRPVTVRVTRQDSLPVWSQSTSLWTAQNHPLVWIPAANFEVAYANEVGLPYEAYKPSLAQTPIIWGAFQSRGEVIVRQFGALDGTTVQAAAVAERWGDIGGAPQWQFIKLAFSRPDSFSSGLAALLTLASAYGKSPTLTADLLNDAALQNWLEPVIDSVPAFSTLGADPALTMSTRGISTGEIALLPERDWLIHYEDLSSVEPVMLVYPENHVILDFPYTIWNGSETSEDERRAARAFGDFLISADQQRAAGENGLRPIGWSDLQQFAPFSAAGSAVQLELSGNEISLPDRPALLAFLRWFSNYRTAP